MSSSPPLPCPGLPWPCLQRWFFKQLHLRFLNIPSDRNVVYKLCMHTQRPWVFVLPNAYSPFFTLCWVLPFPSLTFLDCILYSALLKSHYECTPLCWLRICIFSECHPFAQPKTLVNILNAVRKSRDAEWNKNKSLLLVDCFMSYC